MRGSPLVVDIHLCHLIHWRAGHWMLPHTLPAAHRSQALEHSACSVSGHRNKTPKPWESMDHGNCVRVLDPEQYLQFLSGPLMKDSNWIAGKGWALDLAKKNK